MLVTFAVHHLLPKNHGISSQLMVWRSKRPLLYKPLVMTSISGVHHRKLNLKIGHHRISLPLPARVQALQGRCPRSLGRLTIPGEGLVLYSTKGSDSVDDDFVPSTWVLIFVSGIFGGTPRFARKICWCFFWGGRVVFCSKVSLEILSGFFSMSFRANPHMIEDTLPETNVASGVGRCNFLLGRPQRCCCWACTTWGW